MIDVCVSANNSGMDLCRGRYVDMMKVERKNYKTLYLTVIKIQCISGFSYCEYISRSLLRIGPFH